MRSDSMGKTKVFHARIEEMKLDKFQKICEAKAISPSKLVRLWIDSFIQENANLGDDVLSVSPHLKQSISV